MKAENDAYLDVLFAGGSFTLPRLKWRELVFIGAVRRDGDEWVRDSSRPMPAFAAGDILPEGRRFRVSDEGDRVRIAAASSES